MRESIHWKTATLLALAALLVHGAALWWMQGQSILFSSPTHYHGVGRVERERAVSQEERREEQLAALFQEFEQTRKEQFAGEELEEEGQVEPSEENPLAFEIDWQELPPIQERDLSQNLRIQQRIELPEPLIDQLLAVDDLPMPPRQLPGCEERALYTDLLTALDLTNDSLPIVEVASDPNEMSPPLFQLEPPIDCDLEGWSPTTAVTEVEDEELSNLLRSLTLLMQSEAIGLNEPLLDEECYLPEPLFDRSAARGDPFRSDVKGEIASSDHFATQINYSPSPDGEGYLFSITFVPNQEVSFKRIRQNYSFLIDRSNSIDRKRFMETKQAVSSALDGMDPRDNFNILIFDTRIKKFSNRPIPATRRNVQRAIEFLESEPPGGFFASTDIYASLDKIVPAAVGEKEVNTALLFSDGDTFLDRESQRRAIAQWTAHNSGKVSLFSIAVGKRNNLPLLDLLSSFNKGSLFYVAKGADLTSSFLHLMQSIEVPIGKEIVATAVPTSADNKVVLYPGSQRLPNLYKNRPFTLHGKADRAEPITLFLQGRYYDDHLDIKKSITFDTHPSHGGDLCRSWAIYQAYDLYENYLKSGKRNHLHEASLLLAPHEIEPAFRERQ